MYLFQQTMFDAPSGLNIFGDGVREVQPGEDSFIESDTSAYGNLSNPITLNLRLLDGANPISNIDPTGHFTQEFGELAHLIIANRYLATHPGAIVNPTSGILSALKPDIFDAFHVVTGLTPGGYAEIKPLTFPGITSGLARILIYDRAYGIGGSLHLNFHRITDWPVGVDTVFVAGDPIAYFNFDGLIFYTDAVDDLDELRQLRSPSDLYRFVRESLKNQIEGIKTEVQKLVERTIGEEEAELDDTVAEDTLTSL
jgi:hypothetical protein